MVGVTDVPGYGLEDSLLARFEYQAHKHPEGPSLLLELQRASSIATQRLVNLRLEFKNVVVLQSYADFEFWLDDSLLLGLQTWGNLPPELVSSASSRGPYAELHPELMGQPRGITVADSRENQHLRTHLLDAIGLHALIVCHDLLVTELDDYSKQNTVG